MELIYLYIRKYEDILKNVEFNFSSNYIVTMKDNVLNIDENVNSVKNYYGDNVNNVIMFFGKNVMGKSTLLDILGMNRDDRINDTFAGKSGERYSKNLYFILYHLNENYFAFEFVDDTFLSGENKIINIDMQNEKVQSALYKLPMGNIFLLEDGTFKYCGNITLQWLEKNNIKNKLEYAYITSDKYNNRISNKHREYYEDYMFERRYYLEGSNYEHLYRYLIYLKDVNNELLQDKNIIIENSIKVDERILDFDKSGSEYLYNKKRELDNLFGSKTHLQIELEKKFKGQEIKAEARSNKDIFLDFFYIEAIEYYFLEQFVGWSENQGKIINTKMPEIDMDYIKEKIFKLDEEKRKKIINGVAPIGNFNVEYALLKYKIEENRETNGKINLKSVLAYTLNRVEMAASETADILDRQAVMEMLGLLEELPDSFFSGKRCISIKCESEKLNEKVVSLLKKYDDYFKIRNNENGSNCIYRILNIKLPKMSEGQRVFLDIISKTISAIYAIQPGDSLVLLIDEPDRALHPELSRRFLARLLDNINMCKDRSIQIILSSHSPFIVTDVLPEGVYSIDIEGGKRKIISDKDTYATNIYYLLMDSFMLENTFGEYSYRQLQGIIRNLTETENIDAEKLEWIRHVIDKIGEKAIKKKMLQLYEKKASQKSNIIEMLLQEKDEKKIMEIRKILEKND